MVSSGHEETVWIEQLETKQGEDALNTEASSVHKVSIEEVGILF